MVLLLRSAFSQLSAPNPVITSVPPTMLGIVVSNYLRQRERGSARGLTVEPGGTSVSPGAPGDQGSNPHTQPPILLPQQGDWAGLVGTAVSSVKSSPLSSTPGGQE